MTPVTGLRLIPDQASSDIVVLPITTAPASRRRVTTGLSAAATPLRIAMQPVSVSCPATS